jgi:hypothetical protein
VRCKAKLANPLTSSSGWCREGRRTDVADLDVVPTLDPASTGAAWILYGAVIVGAKGALERGANKKNIVFAATNRFSRLYDLCI